MGVTHLPAPDNATTLFVGFPAVNTAGRTEHFEVFYDRSLGETGRSGGAIVLNRAERDRATLKSWFGGPNSVSDRYTVVLSRRPDDARASYDEGHPDRPTVLCCDIVTTPQLEALQSSFFVTFLLGNLYAANANWDAGSAGALARVLATALYPRRITGFATAWVWLESERHDFTAARLPSTTAATGCAVLFLNYLHHQRGFSWHEIATSPAPTLAAVAKQLTGSDDEFLRFQSLLAEHLPAGEPRSQQGDNFFPLPDGATRPPVDTVGAPTSRREEGQQLEVQKIPH